MYWQLWDVVSGNLMASYESRDEALLAVRDFIAADRELIADLAVGAMYDEGEPPDAPLPPVLEGEDLVAAVHAASAIESTVAESQSLESRVREWLAANFVVEQKSDPRASFNFQVQVVAPTVVHVIQPIDRSDRIGVIGSLEFGPDERALLDRLPRDRQSALETEVWRELIRLDIEFQGSPGVGRMLILSWIFDDATTKDELYRRILLVYRALTLTARLYSREFDRLVRRSSRAQREKMGVHRPWFGGQGQAAERLIPFPELRLA